MSPVRFKRPTSSACEKEVYDLAIVGGGIYGAWLFYMASLAGLKTILVEKNDFGSGTSSNSSKLIHGGLRYLKEGQFSVVRHSIQEKIWYLKHAPFRVKRLPFHVPIYDTSVFSAPEIWLGLKLYSLFESPPFGKKIVSKKFDAEDLSVLHTKDFKCMYGYEDAVTDDFRMVLDLIKGGLTSGGDAFNYVSAKGFQKNNDRFELKIEDQLACVEMCVKSKSLFHSGGYFFPGWQTHQACERRLELTFSQGIHVVLEIPLTRAYVLSSRQDQRVFFLIPWYGKALLGTTDQKIESGSSGTVTDAEINYLLQGLNQFSAREWRMEDILATYVGVRTFCQEGSNGTYHLSRSSSVRELTEGYFVSAGGKLTTSRFDCSQILKKIGRFLKCESRLCALEEIPYPVQGQTVPVGLSPMDTYLYSRYGSEFTAVSDLIREFPASQVPVMPDEPFLEAEIIYAIQQEGAYFAEDVLRRRIPLWLLNKDRKATCQHFNAVVRKYSFLPQHIALDEDGAETSLEKRI